LLRESVDNLKHTAAAEQDGFVWLAFDDGTCDLEEVETDDGSGRPAEALSEPPDEGRRRHLAGDGRREPEEAEVALDEGIE
jgi:uncharacterized protein YecT (DUF1311 family)